MNGYRIVTFFWLLVFQLNGLAQSININGPIGSGQFGYSLTVLNNGNYIIADPYYDEGGITDIGAVYLYNGSTHTLISTLKGTSVNDRVGMALYKLASGNYLVRSEHWNAGTGAVTYCNANTGINGSVSSSNSLVGAQSGDAIGGGNILLLSNGNYIVNSPDWQSGAVLQTGAVTWCNGSTGLTGVVSSSNSLVGSSAQDRVGFTVLELSGSNYIVLAYQWDNGAVVNAGAATWCNGTTGLSGVVSSSNSLVGSFTNDQVGVIVTKLSNGNYVVSSPNWSTNTGAVTWCNGSTGLTGVVSSSNSLVGSFSNNVVGGGGVTPLLNGNYVVNSPSWDAGFSNMGAVTWCNGSTGTTGLVSSSNSLVGVVANDQVGSGFITELSNGNYVVSSPLWDNGAVFNAGAATWCNGTTGRTGAVSSSNSLVGTTASDRISTNSGVFALSNGNYVVRSQLWNNGAIAEAGAVTWCDGTIGRTGAVSSSNSLVGSAVGDRLGLDPPGGKGIVALNNGNYVVTSYVWNNGAVADAGAVTWCNGTTGRTGTINSTNSLVGSKANDIVGSGQVFALPNGNYVVNSYSWDNGTITDAGASTWCDGITGRTGVVSSSNSLVGSTMNDQVGLYVVFLFSNGSYLVRNPNWANGAQSNAGAVTWCDGTTGRTGNISNANSLVGTTSGNSIGIGTTSELPNGNFLLGSWGWDNGALTNVGAYTMGSTTTGIYGEINATNSLIGSSVNDQLGQNGVQVANGNYFTKHNEWDNGALVNAGAVTLGNNSIPLTGYINSCNSVISNLASNSNFMRQTYNNVYDYLLVGRGLENIVTVYFPSGMSLANHLDAVDLTVSGTGKVPFVVTSGCRIIASLTPNGGSQVSGSVNAKVWIESTVPSYAGKPFVARHYQITPATNSSTATGRVTLYFTQQDFDDFNADPASIYDLPAFPNDILGKYNLKVGKYSGTSSNGSGLPGTYAGPSQVINPDDNDIIWNSVLNRWEVSFDVTGFSGFIVQSSSFLLPLSLLSFNGFLLNNDGLLNWKTTNELNAASYDIERSIDGRTYTAVGTVAAYNTAGNHQYNFTDNNITALGVPVVYYRLKQKDIIGRFTYSNIVALSIDRSKSIVLLYPNPVVTNANLTININKPQQVKGRIIDNTGRVLKQMQWSLAAGSTALPVDVKELASGMYYLEITGATLNERKVFVKQ